MMAVAETLNPAQRATLATLGAGDIEARVDFDPAIDQMLRCQLEDGLADIIDKLDHLAPLTITKHLLSGMHGCQARYLDETTRPFQASIPIVRGTVAHKALELAVHWQGTPLPLDLVDKAIQRISDTDHWATEFIITMDAADRAELRGAVAEIVNKFLESWPPLVPAMRPATEAKLWSELCDGRLLLKGQADLTLGQPIGSGTQARKIIVDYKTGGRSPDHRADLRFYALVETLRLGVPPRLLVTDYLNSARLETETVTVGMLTAMAARVVDGVKHFVALRVDEVEPHRAPSGACRWCPLLEHCDIGQDYLAQDR